MDSNFNHFSTASKEGAHNDRSPLLKKVSWVKQLKKGLKTYQSGLLDQLSHLNDLDVTSNYYHGHKQK
jgi:hypothetical protein